MTKLGIRFDEIALEQHPELADQFKQAGYSQAPIIVTDNARWSGFRYDRIQALATQLFGEKNGATI